MRAKTKEIRFTKMTGAGNDFVIVDNRDGSFNLDWSTVAKPLCDRHFGIGADGLIAIEQSDRADFTMNYFNADGSYGGMCGNGGRCAAQFVLGKTNADEIRFEALDHIYSANKIEDKIALSMKDPTDVWVNMFVMVNQEKIKTNFINTGSPHAVIFVADLPLTLQEEISKKGIQEIGSLIRNYESFRPSGTNVNFLLLNEDNSLQMRTYERGVEGETLACGTGAVASAVISNMLLEIPSPVSIIARSGETLTVAFNKTGKHYSHIQLIGSAKILFHGSLAFDTDHNQICS